MVKMTPQQAHTTLTRLEKAGVVRSYYVEAQRVFIMAEKRFKRREGNV
jgi:hypothetical protein